MLTVVTSGLVFSAGFECKRKPVHCVRASICPKVGILSVMASSLVLSKFSPAMDHDDHVSGHRKGVFGAFKSFLGRDKQKEKEVTPSESGHGQPALDIRESVRDYLQSLLLLYRTINQYLDSLLDCSINLSHKAKFVNFASV